MDFKKWFVEDCGEDFSRTNTHPYDKVRSRGLTADDGEIPKKLRGNTSNSTKPDVLFGVKKMKRK